MATDTPSVKPDDKKSKTGWAILFAVLFAGGIALLVKNAGDRGDEKPIVIQPVARNMPPVEVAPAPSEDVVFDPSETTAIAPTTPAEVIGKASKPRPKKVIVADEVEIPMPEGDADEEPIAALSGEQNGGAASEPTPEEAKQAALAEIEAELGATAAEDSRVEIVYREDIPSLRTEEIALTIDGQKITDKLVRNAEDRVENGLMIFSGVLPAGARNVELRVKLRGDGDVFSYLKDYAFNLDHHGTLNVDPDKSTRLTISAAESKNVTREWTDKFALRVDVSTRETGGDIATR